MAENAKIQDLSLPPGSYAYIQDGSKGTVKICTGPTVVTPSSNDKPIIYNDRKHVFEPVNTLVEAVKQYVTAVEGFYIELLNPAKNNVHPGDGQTVAGAELDVGHKINVTGPAMFALWPGQMAKVIRGHHLKSNQYLLCRVYNEEAAEANWDRAIMKKASTIPPLLPDATAEQKAAYAKAVDQEAKKGMERPDLGVGKLFIIPGTKVSFFIPPTGITVVPEGISPNGQPMYVRDALTLEALEYCVLVDENGRKRYENGPKVVFPKPTETFRVDGKGVRKFTAIELNKIQGIHVKVTADYMEADGTQRKMGDELFITGENETIYYPREEHSAIKYDGKTKHYATAIPDGEGRYVLNRETGVIDMKLGPDMLLPDPRTSVIVRRALSDRECFLWYPGNEEAMVVNRELRKLAMAAPSTRAGTVSDGQSQRARGPARASEQQTKGGMLLGDTERERAISSYMVSYSSNVSNAMMMDSSGVSRDQDFQGDEFSRQSTYTAPRTITLDTKYQGVPTIRIWNNYAVLVTRPNGDRRVEVGPKTVHLKYDETLEVLTLSTAKPKTTDNVLTTPYLKVRNNNISDIITIETADHVQVEIKLKYLVNFEGEGKDTEKWFSVENYVKFLCDHMRSVLKGTAQTIKIEDFFKGPTDLIRNVILGKDQGGTKFEENGMEVSDVEILSVEIKDERVRRMLMDAQYSVVSGNIELANLRRGLEITKEKEEIKRKMEEATTESEKQKIQLQIQLAAVQLELALGRLANELKQVEEQKKLDTEKQVLKKQQTESHLALAKMESDQDIAQRTKEQDLRIAQIKAEAEAVVSKFKAFEGQLSIALLELSRNETLIKTTDAFSVLKILGGNDISEVFNKMFAGTSLESVMKKVTAGVVNGASKSENGSQSQART